MTHPNRLLQVWHLGVGVALSLFALLWGFVYIVAIPVVGVIFLMASLAEWSWHSLRYLPVHVHHRRHVFHG